MDTQTEAPQGFVTCHVAIDDDFIVAITAHEGDNAVAFRMYDAERNERLLPTLTRAQAVALAHSIYEAVEET